MKASLAFLFLTALVTVSVGQDHSHGNGQPLCNDPFEFTRLWRNNWDPNSYFRCDTTGVRSTIVRCQGQAFIESQQRCGDWSEWVWQTPFDPPHHN